MPQFDATIKHIHEGLKSFTVAAATKNIEGWEATLEKLDTPAAKTIVKDLESLKKHLHADKINGEQVKKLVLKLGKETVAIASKTEGKNAEKIKALGEALSHAAETAEAAGRQPGGPLGVGRPPVIVLSCCCHPRDPPRMIPPAPSVGRGVWRRRTSCSWWWTSGARTACPTLAVPTSAPRTWTACAARGSRSATT